MTKRLFLFLCGGFSFDDEDPGDQCNTVEREAKYHIIRKVNDEPALGRIPDYFMKNPLVSH